MTTFWKSLTQIAQGQLFIGGHLSPSVVAAMAKRKDCSVSQQKDARDHLPWPRLAMPH